VAAGITSGRRGRAAGVAATATAVKATKQTFETASLVTTAVATAATAVAAAVAVAIGRGDHRRGSQGRGRLGRGGRRIIAHQAGRRYQQERSVHELPSQVVSDLGARRAYPARRTPWADPDPSPSST